MFRVNTHLKSLVEMGAGFGAVIFTMTRFPAQYHKLWLLGFIAVVIGMTHDRWSKLFPWNKNEQVEREDTN